MLQALVHYLKNTPELLHDYFQRCSNNFTESWFSH